MEGKTGKKHEDINIKHGQPIPSNSILQTLSPRKNSLFTRFVSKILICEKIQKVKSKHTRILHEGFGWSENDIF